MLQKRPHRRIIKTLCICLALFIGNAFAAGDHAHTDMSKPIKDYRQLTPDEVILQTVLDGYANAMAQRSIEAMEQVVIPGDFSTIESGYPNWTWEDFRDSHLSAEFKAFSDATYNIDLIAGETQGSLGFAVFKYTAAGKAQGRTISISGLGTAILESNDSGPDQVWRIHHLHTSAPRDQLEKAAGGAQHKPANEHGAIQHGQ
jgi:hypothetical protein